MEFNQLLLKSYYLYIHTYIYIYITKTFEILKIFHINIILKKKQKKNTFLKPDSAFTLHDTVHPLPAFRLPTPPQSDPRQANQTHGKPTLKHHI